MRDQRPQQRRPVVDCLDDVEVVGLQQADQAVPEQGEVFGEDDSHGSSPLLNARRARLSCRSSVPAHDRAEQLAGQLLGHRLLGHDVRRLVLVVQAGEPASAAGEVDLQPEAVHERVLDGFRVGLAGAVGPGRDVDHVAVEGAEDLFDRMDAEVDVVRRCRRGMRAGAVQLAGDSGNGRAVTDRRTAFRGRDDRDDDGTDHDQADDGEHRVQPYAPARWPRVFRESAWVSLREFRSRGVPCVPRRHGRSCASLQSTQSLSPGQGGVKRHASDIDRAQLIGEDDSHGNSIVTTVGPPGGLVTVSRPSKAPSRRSIPRSPLPAPGVAPPRPSSRTCIDSTPSACRSRTHAPVAPLCRITFVSASATAKYDADSTGAGSRSGTSASTWTGSGLASASASTAPTRPRSARTGGWIPRTSPRSSASAWLLTARACASSSFALSGSSSTASSAIPRFMPSATRRAWAPSCRSRSIRRISAACVSTVSARDSASCRTRLASRVFSLGERRARAMRALVSRNMCLGSHQNTRPSSDSTIAMMYIASPTVLLTSSHARSRHVAGSLATDQSLTSNAASGTGA